jgi:phage terminase Nu1 subunit (DNA packaging protein)
MGVTVNRRQLAEIVGKTEKTIREWQLNEGLPVQLSGVQGRSNKYDTAEVINWMIARSQSKTVSDGKGYAYEAERARLTHHQANKTALEEQVLAGKLLPADEVEQAWLDMAMAMRAKLLSLPGKLATAAVAATTLREVEQAARAEIYAALNDIANGADWSDAETDPSESTVSLSTTA